MVQILALIIKEFRAIWRDKPSRSILFVPPLLQLFIFAFAVTLEVKNINLAVYNLDSGKESHELIQRLTGSPQFKEILFLDSEDEIQPTMDQKKASITLTFPSDFSRKLRQGKSATIQAAIDGRHSNSGLIVLGYLNEIADNYARGLNPDKPRPGISSIVISRHWFNENLDYAWFTVTSLIAIIAMFTAMALSSLTIARERELGTFEQILVTPLTPSKILIGKLLPGIVVGLSQSFIIFLFAIYAFKIPFLGSPLYLIPSMLVFLLAIVGIGLFISSLSTTQQQSVLGTFVAMTPIMTISGFGVPVENIHYSLQYVAELSPLKHFLIIIKGVFLKNMPPADIWANTWPNILIACVTVSTSVWLFRRRIE